MSLTAVKQKFNWRSVGDWFEIKGQIYIYLALAAAFIILLLFGYLDDGPLE